MNPDSKYIILVTGGCGFIGCNFIMYMLSKYPAYKIINLDKLTYASVGKQALDDAHNGNYTFVQGDVCDAVLVDMLVKKSDIVVNFAAESHVDRSITDPQIFVQSNVVGTHCILEAVRKHNKRFHHVSTDEVFGSLEQHDEKFSEQTKYDPHSPYSASKAASDHFVRAYHKTFGIAATISNCSNNYGPYQHPEKMIPLFITNLLQNKKLPLYGTGMNIRDWLHVSDHVRALDMIIHSGHIGETYCIGGNTELSNIEIARIMLSKLGLSEDYIEFVPDRRGHDYRYGIDYSKISTELGWKPLVTFEHGIDLTIDWYKQSTSWLDSIKNIKCTYHETVGILLVGGTGTRLYPSTKVTNKHLLNVYDRPMIDYPLHTLLDQGITNIVVVSSIEFIGTIIKYVTDKKNNALLPCMNFTFKVQTEADGIAGALMLCKELIKNKIAVVILGDNIYEETPRFVADDNETCLVVKRLQNPEQFGVAIISNDKILEVVEKPKKFISDYVVTGLYKFDTRLYYFLSDLHKSQRGEYEITDIINKYIDSDKNIKYILYDKFWSDAGTQESLYKCATFMRNKFTCAFDTLIPVPTEQKRT